MRFKLFKDPKMQVASKPSEQEKRDDLIKCASDVIYKQYLEDAQKKELMLRFGATWHFILTPLWIPPAAMLPKEGCGFIAKTEHDYLVVKDGFREKASIERWFANGTPKLGWTYFNDVNKPEAENGTDTE